MITGGKTEQLAHGKPANGCRSVFNTDLTLISEVQKEHALTHIRRPTQRSRR
jgi:hypothetical protein